MRKEITPSTSNSSKEANAASSASCGTSVGSATTSMGASDEKERAMENGKGRADANAKEETERESLRASASARFVYPSHFALQCLLGWPAHCASSDLSALSGESVARRMSAESERSLFGVALLPDIG